MERGPDGLCKRVDLGVTPTGDDNIPEESAVLEGAEIHPVRQHHGALYVDNDVKMRLQAGTDAPLTAPPANGHAEASARWTYLVRL